ncbi:MAG: hypothetical protein HOW97_08990 [Catenulispora sp.]|nr:hypothetical protein [Catenulispora sp.]
MAYHCGAPTRDGSACQRHVREQGVRCHQHRALGGAALPPLRLAMRTITLEDPALTAGPAAWMSARDEIAATHAAQWDTPLATAQDGPETPPPDPEPADPRQPYRPPAPHSRPTRILFGDPDDDLPQRRRPRPEREDAPNEPARPDQRGTRIIEDYLRRHEQGEDDADADARRAAEEARREREHRLAEEARRELERRQAENVRREQEQNRADEHRSEQERRLADERRREQEQRRADERRREQERDLAEQARRKREQRGALTQRAPEEAETDVQQQKVKEARREQENAETDEQRQKAEARREQKDAETDEQRQKAEEARREQEDAETDNQRQKVEEARREQEQRLAEQAQRKRQQREAEEARREQEQAKRQQREAEEARREQERREAREARREQQQRRVEEARREREQREAEERRQADDARWLEVAELLHEREEQPAPDPRPLFRDEAPTLIQPRIEVADEVAAPAPPRPPRISPLRSVVLNPPEPAPEAAADPDPPTLVGLPDGLTVPDLVVPGFSEPAPKPPLRTVLSTVLGPELWQRCYAEWGPAHCISLARVARAVDGLAPSAAAALRSTAGASMRWLGVNREREELADQVANAISHPAHASDANRARTIRLYGAAICVALNIPMRRCACHRDLDRDVSSELIRLGLEELAGEVP